MGDEASQVTVKNRSSHPPTKYDVDGDEIGVVVILDNTGLNNFMMPVGAVADGDLRVVFQTSTDGFSADIQDIPAADVDGNKYDVVFTPVADEVYQWMIHREMHDVQIRAKITVDNATSTNGIDFGAFWMESELRAKEPVDKNA